MLANTLGGNELRLYIRRVIRRVIRLYDVVMRISRIERRTIRIARITRRTVRLYYVVTYHRTFYTQRVILRIRIGQP